MNISTTYKSFTASLITIIVFSSFHLANPVDETSPLIYPSNDSRLSEYKQLKYKKDATRLALRLLSAHKDYIDINAEVPSEMVSSIYGALVAVHTSELPKAAEVTKRHKLHTFPMPSIDQFFVIYEKTADWCQPLRLGGNTTDNTKINQLLKTYDLAIDQHMEWDEMHNSFNVRAQSSLNMAPVAQLFSTMDNVLLVDLLVPDGDGNDIEIKELKGGWEINYYVKFDTCITGCKQRHVWTFEVLDGHATFVKEWGDDLPNWMKKNG